MSAGALLSSGRLLEAPDPQALGAAAAQALRVELALYPKPGLVSYHDSGSHRDMDAGTFERSIESLHGYFPQMVRLGAAGAAFDRLRSCGVEAERRMLLATGGVNTHRGAIFLLGLLCAAAGRTGADDVPLTKASLRHALRAAWGEALQRHAGRSRASHGGVVAARHGLRGAAAEAAAGFPTLFDKVMPQWERAALAGAGPRRRHLHTLFSAMAHMDDTNIAHRGGLRALRTVQRVARRCVDSGRLLGPQAEACALGLHQRFVARGWSPGGAADMLAAACWLDAVCGPGDA